MGGGDKIQCLAEHIFGLHELFRYKLDSRPKTSSAARVGGLELIVGS